MLDLEKPLNFPTAQQTCAFTNLLLPALQVATHTSCRYPIKYDPAPIQVWGRGKWSMSQYRPWNPRVPVERRKRKRGLSRLSARHFQFTGVQEHFVSSGRIMGAIAVSNSVSSPKEVKKRHQRTTHAVILDTHKSDWALGTTVASKLFKISFEILVPHLLKFVGLSP